MQTYKTIPLCGKRGGKTKVDADNYDWLNKHRWFKSSLGYAFRQGWKGTQRDSKNHWTIWMHREVNQTPPGLFTDHINHDKLDNRRANLRTVDKSKNSANRFKIKKHKLSSKFKGVSFHPSTGLWRARIQDKGQQKTTYHETELQAALDYNRMAKECFGANSLLNDLPPDITPTVPRTKSSQFIGVSKTQYNRWHAAIEKNGKQYHIGNFEDEGAAALAYNKAARKMHGDRARLNTL